jgi:V/A-type H+-transporting ATPase subunit I
VIVTMQKLRIIGPRPRLAATIDTLQHLGSLHMCPVDPSPPLATARPTPRQLRHERDVRAALEDIEEAISRLGLAGAGAAPQASTMVEPLPREVRLARRARRAALRLVGELRAVEEERANLARLLEQLDAFSELEELAAAPGRRLVYLVLARDQRDGLAGLERALSESVGDDFTLHTRPLDGAELAVVLSVSLSNADRLEAILPEAGVREIELPVKTGLSGPRVAAQEVGLALSAIDARLAALESRRKNLAAWLRPGLLRARAALHDWLIASEARTNAGVTDHIFVLDGWLPAEERSTLADALAERVGATIVIEQIAKEQWSSPDAPVAIHNPPLLRPFEVITRNLPAPRYGTLDPTPFVAVFFPLFFGLILGDIGYGALLAGLSILGWRRSQSGTTLRAVSQIAAACAIFSMLFGVFFGELFGDLGHRLFGLHSLSFSREEAVIPFLILAVSIGFVHVVLGLVLGALSSMRSTPRHSLGRGLTALMLVLTAGVLLAALNVLPASFFKPAVIALLLSFPILILLEGVVAPIEFLSRLSNILSYARIMALGTASVMLATVANQMVGMVGGAVVGVLFATLFHLVNFGLGVFSPTIHSLRLHFVEFFGTFYSPGDQVYQPLRHWRPPDGPTPQSA